MLNVFCGSLINLLLLLLSHDLVIILDVFNTCVDMLLDVLMKCVPSGIVFITCGDKVFNTFDFGNNSEFCEPCALEPLFDNILILLTGVRTVCAGFKINCDDGRITGNLCKICA